MEERKRCFSGAFVFLFMLFLVFSLPVVFALEANYSLVYDGNGNLISGDGLYREYNGFNQLVRVYNGSDDSGDLLEEYLYHPIEDRVLIKYGKYSVNSPDEATVYFNDNFVKDYKNLIGTPDVNYTYYVFDGMGMVGEIVKNVSYLGDDFNLTKTLFYHNDHLGSVGVLTNESGDVVSEMFYGPFGEILQGGDLSRYSYEGKEFSSATGDFDFDFRKYDPDLMIFTQPDSMISDVYDPQSLNRYAFERNNPYGYVDPDGKTFIDPSDLTSTNQFKYSWKFGRGEVFSNLKQDLSDTWNGDDFETERGVWSATGEPFYDVADNSIEIVSRVSGGKDHPFASQDLGRSSKDLLFSGSSAALTFLGLGGVGGKALTHLGRMDAASSFFLETGLLESSYNLVGPSTSLSVSYDQSKSTSSNAGKSSSSSSLSSSSSKRNSVRGVVSNTVNKASRTAKNFGRSVRNFFRRAFRR